MCDETKSHVHASACRSPRRGPQPTSEVVTWGEQSCFLQHRQRDMYQDGLVGSAMGVRGVVQCWVTLTCPCRVYATSCSRPHYKDMHA